MGGIRLFLSLRAYLISSANHPEKLTHAAAMPDAQVIGTRTRRLILPVQEEKGRSLTVLRLVSLHMAVVLPQSATQLNQMTFSTRYSVQPRVLQNFCDAG
jgi:hypothetical protein